MPAYVIYQGQVSDQERYEEYKPLAAASITAAGGRYLVRGGDVDALEGEPPTGRTVVVEFETMRAAREWYESELYTSAREVRKGAATASMFVVGGIS